MILLLMLLMLVRLEMRLAGTCGDSFSSIFSPPFNVCNNNTTVIVNINGETVLYRVASLVFC